MRSLKSQPMCIIAQGVVIISSIIFSPSIVAQELLAPLSLRLGPAIGFPVSIELSTNTPITVTQRRNNWLLVTDERGEGGWAMITDVELSGGLADRQAWRLSELKRKDFGDLQGRWFANEQGYGLSFGWKLRTSNGHWLAEVERASNAQSQWQAFSTWYAFDYELTGRSYYSAGFALGYAHENSHSHVFNTKNDSMSTLFAGAELSLGFVPTKRIDTGLSVRYLQTLPTTRSDSTVISWYWAFGI